MFLWYWRNSNFSFCAKTTFYIFSNISYYGILGDVMNFKDYWTLCLVIGALLIVITIMIYFIHSPALPLLIVPTFIIMKFLESHFKKYIGSRWAKGFSYLGLGIVVLIGILANSTNDIGASFYVVTMCFIEFVDVCFEWKPIETLDGKKHSEGLVKVQSAQLKKTSARITKSNRKV
jgi:hypothetical protein